MSRLPGKERRRMASPATFSLSGRSARMSRVALMLALLVLLVPGCALTTATSLEAEVAAVELRGLGLLDQTLAVALCVSNPTDAGLSFRRVAAALEIAGAPLVEGASEAPVQLPPRSSVVVPFTVTTTVRNLGAQLLDVVGSGGVEEYRVRGRVQLDGTLPVTLPFSRSGRLDLIAVGTRMLSLPGQLNLLATGTRLLEDSAAAASSDTRCGKVALF